MRWLLHGSLTPAAAQALVRHGHKIHAPAEADLAPDAPAQSVLQSAAKRQWDILSTDSALASSLFAEKSPFPRSIVLLLVPAGDVEQDDAIDRLFARYKRLTPARLYTVNESRVKVRQLPSGSRPMRT